jgi:hypothetical protein
MRKANLLIIAVLAITTISCGLTRRSPAVKPAPESIISPAISLINRCSSDTSLNTMAYKAAYDTTTSSLVVFLGKNIEHFDYKWIIPLKQVDKTGLSLFRVDFNVSSVTLNIFGGQSQISYYKDGNLKSKSPQFVLYLGKCFSSEEKDKVVDLIYKTIVEVQK